MTQALINLGAAPNDGTGDPARIGGQKINDNFTELYGRTSPSSTNQTTGQIASAVLIQQSRKVVNLLTHTEDFSNAAWFKSGTCTVTGTNTINFPAAIDNIEAYFSVNCANRSYVGRVSLSGTGTVIISISNNIDYAPTALITLTATPTTYSMLVTMNATVSSDVGFVIQRIGGGTATQVTADFAQLEDVTGLANQNPSEYVSVGVLPAPYHGTGIDGEQYFNYANGNTVDPTTHVVTEAQGAALAVTPGMGFSAPNGTPYMWGTFGTYANNAAAVAAGLVVGNLYFSSADPHAICIVQ